MHRSRQTHRRGSFSRRVASQSDEENRRYTARGEVRSAYFKNCDLAVPGSPRSSTLMSPRIRCFASTFSLSFSPPIDSNWPPNSAIAIAIFTSAWPKSDGAIELRRRRSNSGSAANPRIYARFPAAIQRPARPRATARCSPSRPSSATRCWPRLRC